MSPLSAIPAYSPGTLPQVNALTSSDLSQLPAAAPVTGATPIGGDVFSSLLGKMVSEVNAKQQISGQMINALQSGQNVPLHQAVISMEEASVSFQLMVQVRNKLLESYQEIMRMQI
jgi:flagellar hook-basal body complex protein FliE